MNALAPIEAPYRLAVPLSWARAFMKPLGMALRRIAPDQACLQRELSALERVFTVTATTENRWTLSLQFNGPDLIVSLHPPESVASAALDHDLGDINPADPPMEDAA